jgi:hypothetical protein
MTGLWQLYRVLVELSMMRRNLVSSQALTYFVEPGVLCLEGARYGIEAHLFC